MDEIVVIRAADLDGSVFKAAVDALNGKRTKVVHRCPRSPPCCASESWRSIMSTAGVLVASREVRLNHGDYALLTCMASSPGQVFSKAQLYAAAWGEEYLPGTTSVENIIWRLRKK